MSEWNAGLGTSWVAYCAVRVPDMRFTPACFLVNCMFKCFDTVTCHGTIQLCRRTFVVSLALSPGTWRGGAWVPGGPRPGVEGIAPIRESCIDFHIPS